MSADASGMPPLQLSIERLISDDRSLPFSNAPATPSPGVTSVAMPAVDARSSSTPRSAVSAATSRAGASPTVASAQLALYFGTTNTRNTEPDGALLPKPKTRAECCQGPRPCPWVSCRHHLLLTVSAARLRLNRPTRTRRPSLGQRAAEREVELWTDDAVETLQRMSETCALDVAEQVADGELTQLGKRRLGRLLGVTPSGARKEIRRAEALLRIALTTEDDNG